MTLKFPFFIFEDEITNIFIHRDTYPIIPQHSIIMLWWNRCRRLVMWRHKLWGQLKLSCHRDAIWIAIILEMMVKVTGDIRVAKVILEWRSLRWRCYVLCVNTSTQEIMKILALPMIVIHRSYTFNWHLFILFCFISFIQHSLYIPEIVSGIHLVQIYAV